MKLYKIIRASTIYFIMNTIVSRILHNGIAPVFALAKIRLFVSTRKEVFERAYKFGKRKFLHLNLITDGFD